MKTKSQSKVSEEAIKAHYAFSEHLLVTPELNSIVGDVVPYQSRLHQFKADSKIGPHVTETKHLWDEEIISLDNGDDAIVYRYYSSASTERAYAFFFAYREAGVEMDELLFHQFYRHELKNAYVIKLLGTAFTGVVKAMSKPRHTPAWTHN